MGAFRDALRWIGTPAGDDTLRDRLLVTFDALAPAERRLLVMIAERALAGQRAYGALNPAEDLRDLRGEALEELADAVFYLGADLLRAKQRGDA